MYDEFTTTTLRIVKNTHPPSTESYSDCRFAGVFEGIGQALIQIAKSCDFIECGEEQAKIIGTIQAAAYCAWGTAAYLTTLNVGQECSKETAEICSDYWTETAKQYEIEEEEFCDAKYTGGEHKEARAIVCDGEG
jgi:hypothetical protein